jgi:hypothetical protein
MPAFQTDSKKQGLPTDKSEAWISLCPEIWKQAHTK